MIWGAQMRIARLGGSAEPKRPGEWSRSHCHIRTRLIFQVSWSIQ